LPHGSKTGRPQNEIKQGGDFFAGLYADANRLAGLLKAMTGISMGSAVAIAEKFPWRDYKTFADIGAAQGGLGVQVGLAHPHLRGFGFDLPAVWPHFEAYVRQHGLSDRIGFKAGNFFADPLPQADAGDGARAARLGSRSEKGSDRQGVRGFT
jgi:hypothetical protein